MTTSTTASLAIAQTLGVSQINAGQSPLHAARARAEAQVHAEVVERLLARLGIDPVQALDMITATEAVVA